MKVKSAFDVTTVKHNKLLSVNEIWQKNVQRNIVVEQCVCSVRKVVI